MEGFQYRFTIVMKDGTKLEDQYARKPEEVAYIHFKPKRALSPPYLFFFTKDNIKLERFFGKAYISTSGSKDYFYCMFTDKCRIFINAFDGTVVHTDDIEYFIKK